MYVSYRKPVGLLVGGMPELPAHQFRSSGLAFAHSTLHFTTVPATKYSPNPLFTYPNRPLRADFDQIGVPPLGELWESFWSPRRPPGDPQGAPGTPQEATGSHRKLSGSLRKPQEALRKPQEASGNPRNPRETSGSSQESSGSHRKAKPIYQPSIGSETPDSSPLATSMLLEIIFVVN